MNTPNTPAHFLKHRDTVIHESVEIEPFTVIHEDVEIGEGTRIGSHVVIKPGTKIGKDCFIDNGVNFSGGDTVIGDGVTIRNHAVICRECVVMDGAFISPQVMTIYQKFNADGSIEKMGGTIIGKNAHIGTNATLDAGVKIGENAIVDAKAYVNRDVMEDSTVVGVPARQPLKDLHGDKFPDE